MKLFHRITISLSEDDMKLIEELRRDSGDSLSKIFREAIQLYYNLLKASKAAGVDFRKYFANATRLAFHINGVEQKQFAVIDREIYRVMLKKLQEKVPPESIESDEEFRSAVAGVVKLFEITRDRWSEYTDEQKLEEILSTMEFAGAGTFARVGDKEYIVNTYAESTAITKLIISSVLASAGLKVEIDHTPGKIFIRL